MTENNSPRVIDWKKIGMVIVFLSMLLMVLILFFDVLDRDSNIQPSTNSSLTKNISANINTTRNINTTSIKNVSIITNTTIARDESSYAKCLKKLTTGTPECKTIICAVENGVLDRTKYLSKYTACKK